MFQNILRNFDILFCLTWYFALVLCAFHSGRFAVLVDVWLLRAIIDICVPGRSSSVVAAILCLYHFIIVRNLCIWLITWKMTVYLDWRDRGLLSHRQATWSCCWSVWTWASTDERVKVPLSSSRGRGVIIACRISTGSLCCCAGVDLSSLRTEIDGSLSGVGGTDLFCRFLLRASFSAKAVCSAPAIASLTASNRLSSAS